MALPALDLDPALGLDRESEERGDREGNDSGYDAAGADVKTGWNPVRSRFAWGLVLAAPVVVAVAVGSAAVEVVDKVAAALVVVAVVVSVLGSPALTKVHSG